MQLVLIYYVRREVERHIKVDTDSLKSGPDDLLFRSILERSHFCCRALVIVHLGSSPHAHTPLQANEFDCDKATDKAYEFIRFGDSHGPEPYSFLGFGDIHGPKPYKFIGFGDIHGPKPYKFIGYG